MLSRSNSDRSHHIRHSRSSLSDQRPGPLYQRSSLEAPRHHGIYPETTRINALRAANVAIVKAQNRNSAEQRRSAEIATINSIAMRRAQERVSRSAEMPRSLQPGRSKSKSHLSDRVTPRRHVIRSEVSAADELRRQRSMLRQHAPTMASSLHLDDDDVPAPAYQAVPPFNDYGKLVACNLPLRHIVIYGKWNPC